MSITWCLFIFFLYNHGKSKLPSCWMLHAAPLNRRSRETYASLSGICITSICNSQDPKPSAFASIYEAAPKKLVQRRKPTSQLSHCDVIRRLASTCDTSTSASQIPSMEISTQGRIAHLHAKRHTQSRHLHPTIINSSGSLGPSD